MFVWQCLRFQSFMSVEKYWFSDFFLLFLFGTHCYISITGYSRSPLVTQILVYLAVTAGHSQYAAPPSSLPINVGWQALINTSYWKSMGGWLGLLWHHTGQAMLNCINQTNNIYGQWWHSGQLSHTLTWKYITDPYKVVHVISDAFFITQEVSKTSWWNLALYSYLVYL